MAISTAASADSGMRFSTTGISAMLASSQTAWRMVDSRESAPASTLAELRTMTEVTGMPPSRPETKLPVPCASSSRFLSVTRRLGSSSSTALTLSSDLRLATMASVSAVVHTMALPMASNDGSWNSAMNAAGAFGHRHVDQMRSARWQGRAPWP